MRSILSLVLLVGAMLLGVPAAAMQQSDAPTKFNIPWASSAVSPYVRNIPQASQIGIQNCAASLTDGFPPLTFVPASGGGCPPFGSDFNGIIKQITQWSRWGQANGPVFWDSAFSVAVGGYPKGAVLQSSVLAGRLWISTAENNLTNPDATTAAGWTVLPGTLAPGQPTPTFNNIAPPNTVSANGTTVGNASSNATGSANADTYWLFVRIWTDCPNTTCALFNSSGGTIARGASANADFAANNAIATYNMNGGALMGADSQSGTTSTNLLNVPVTLGSRTVAGSVLGENLHTLSVGELAVHSHANSLTDPQHSHNGGQAGNQIAPVSATGSTIGWQSASVPTNPASTGITITNANAGSGTAHNTVARSFLVQWWLAK